MKKIFYGLSGEGLGHASRTLAMIDHLPDCEVHVFTYGKALDFFTKLNYPFLHPIRGVMFSYTNGRVNYLETAKTVWKYQQTDLIMNINKITDLSEVIKPDLFITDFEPSIARATKLCGKKLISIDNQHRFAYYDMIDMPISLRVYGWLVGLVAKVIVPKPDHTIISTFHFDQIHVRHKNVTITNGFVRKDMEERKPSKEFVLVYLRDSVCDRVLRAIQWRGTNMKIYGANKDSPVRKSMERFSNFEFCELSPTFMEDLTNCSAVIATAGNQLITEARYHQKPILAIPEPGQYEQYINAFYVHYLRLGRKCEIQHISEEIVHNFLKMKGAYHIMLRYAPNGVEKALEVIRGYLS